MAIIELSDVHKTFIKAREAVEVLMGIDLTVEQGDFVALMGPSGSGKTTLLNIVGGLDDATAGDVVVAEANLDELSNRELARWRAATIGFVFQFLQPAARPQRPAQRRTTAPPDQALGQAAQQKRPGGVVHRRPR